MSEACWSCGKGNDQLVNMLGNPRGPKDGDAALCFWCYEFSVVDGDTIRKPTDLELFSILADPRANEIIEEAKRIKAQLN